MRGFVLLTFLVVSGCSETSTESTRPVSADDVRREVSEALDAVAQFTIQKRDELVASMNDQLQEYDAEIKQLESEARTLGDEAQQNLESQLTELRKKRDTFRQRMDELAECSEQTWDNVKADTSRALDDLRQAVHEATAPKSGKND